MKRDDILTIFGIFVAMLLYAGVLQTAKVGCFFLWGCLILGTVLDLIEGFWAPVFENGLVGDLIVWAFYIVLLEKIHAGLWLYTLLVILIFYPNTRSMVGKVAELVLFAALDLGILITIHAGAILYTLLLLKWTIAAVISGCTILSMRQRQIKTQKHPQPIG